VETGQHNKNEPVLENKHLMTHPSRTLDPPFSLVDRAREIEAADETINSHVSGKLDLIVAQIRSLKEEAKKILEQAEMDMHLHRIKCSFEKKPGQTIHLYKKENQEKYFSMLSPDDWKGNPPHEFCGSYRLRTDDSFERILDP